MRLAFNIHAMMLEEKLRPQHTHAKRGKKEITRETIIFIGINRNGQKDN